MKCSGCSRCMKCPPAPARPRTTLEQWRAFSYARGAMMSCSPANATVGTLIFGLLRPAAASRVRARVVARAPPRRTPGCANASFTARSRSPGCSSTPGDHRATARRRARSRSRAASPPRLRAPSVKKWRTFQAARRRPDATSDAGSRASRAMRTLSGATRRRRRPRSRPSRDRRRSPGFSPSASISASTSRAERVGVVLASSGISRRSSRA